MRIIKLTVLVLILIAIANIFDLSAYTDKAATYIDRKLVDSANQATIATIKEENIIPKEKVIRGENIAEEPTSEELTDKINRGDTSNFANSEPIPFPSPEQGYLEVDFICQAPLQTTSNWTLHEESCEEAALLMTYLYETGGSMTKQEANDEILKMIAWQEENLGGHLDLYANDMKRFINGYYGISNNKIKITYSASIQDIKNELNAGHPVIVPITGEILKNPYYPYPGYHMLIVIGYTEDRIITNDNGTKRGEDFSYDIKVFEEAMNDAGGDIIVLDL